MPKVSICIPAYNHAPFLQQRIDSILNQTFQDFELIVLDDCSIDNSRMILEPLGNHANVSYLIFNERNSGSPFKQWQKGIELAKGKHIWIAESDDLMQPDFLEKAVSVFEQDELIGIFQCGSKWIDENGIVYDEDDSRQQSGICNGRAFIKSNMLLGNSIYNASAVVFKKSLVKLPLNNLVGLFKYCGDWLFWIQLLQDSNLYYLNENLNYYRRHHQNVSGKAEKDGLFYIEGIQVYGYIKKNIIKGGKFFNKAERTFAFRFAKENFEPSIRNIFFKKSLQVSFLIPFYVMWYSLKWNFSKS